MSARAQQHGGVRFCVCRQPEQNSAAGCAFTERARRQPEGTTARRRALLHAATSTARAQQHGGVRFYRAALTPRQQPEHNSTAARASAEAAMAAKAQQHGGVRFCRTPRQPEQNSTAGFAFTERAAWAPGHPRSLCGSGWLVFSAVLCVSRARRCAAQLGVLGTIWACLAAPRAAWVAAPHAHGRNSTLAGSSTERIFF